MGGLIRTKLGDSISSQILKSVLRLYFAAAILITAVQLYLEFSDTKKVIQQDMNGIATTFEKSLEKAVFNYDDALISSILLGIEKN